MKHNIPSNNFPLHQRLPYEYTQPSTNPLLYLLYFHVYISTIHNVHENIRARITQPHKQLCILLHKSKYKQNKLCNKRITKSSRFTGFTGVPLCRSSSNTRSSPSRPLPLVRFAGVGKRPIASFYIINTQYIFKYDINSHIK